MTHSDAFVSWSGVAYGSDIDKVKEILESVAHEHPEVITDGRAPAPRALFMEFGDSSLNFELRVRIDRIDRRFSVQSDLNFAIEQAFREAHITIPFPQRDLHLVSYPRRPGTANPRQRDPMPRFVLRHRFIRRARREATSKKSKSTRISTTSGGPLLISSC